MSFDNIQDLLPLVERPSRYLGSEINTVRKDHRQVRLSVALAFPDLYEIGTSHFGLQILYHILNAHPEIAAERVFAPAADMEAGLRDAGLPLVSLESSTPLMDFDIIGFSLLYELNYTNMLTMLDLAGIPFYADQRDTSHPVIIAGGPCTCNPEPVADFFDAIVIGDGETVILEMARAWMDWKDRTAGHRDTLLSMWAKIEGVYVPAFFKPVYDAAGFQTLEPLVDDHSPVTRALVPDLNRIPFPDAPVIPFGRPVHDRLRLELSRGCTRGCRFCQAGMIYRPVRERSLENLIALADASLAATGYEDLSLLSLSTGDFGCISDLMEHLIARGESDHTAVSLPSIRAGTLTPTLMNLIKRVRKTGFTIAPEAGSQRLRDVINKNITDDDIFETVENAFRLGWQVIKLYFMIGLPTETDEDLAALVELVQRLRRIRPQGRQRGTARSKINVSVTTFIPKPHTPFQWAPQLSLEESKQKIDWLKQALDLPGIQFKWQNPHVSCIEGLWSRGDRRLSRLLTAAYQNGCRFDGWSDKFSFERWQQSIRKSGIDLAFYTTRHRSTADPLPWDFIDMKLKKSFLISELNRAYEKTPTPDCRQGECNACGVCDFNRIAPVTFDRCRPGLPPPLRPKNVPVYKTLQVTYAKTGRARYFGHLEMMNIFLRALRRTGTPLKYSQGFHPLPKISFDDPLPMGMESHNELFYITVPENISPDAIVHGLNAHLPEGLVIDDCRPAVLRSERRKKTPVSYQIILKGGFFDQKAIRFFQNRSDAVITRTSPKGKIRSFDLKQILSGIDLSAPDTLQITLDLTPGIIIRPIEIVSAIFDIDTRALKQARVIKLKPDASAGSG